jgi:glycerol uptake facilitator-like aquaporin
MAERLAGGNRAVALLANALATGAGLTVLISVLAPISGAHFNPVVSLALAMRGMLPWRRLGGYWAAQMTGACAGVVLANLMFGLAPIHVSTHVRADGAQALSEATATFGLLLTVLALLRFRPSAVAGGVGLYIAAAYWFTASTAFANPAAAVARMLTDSFAGIAPGSVFPFVVAQFAGAAAALGLTAWLLEEDPAYA